MKVALFPVEGLVASLPNNLLQREADDLTPNRASLSLPTKLQDQSLLCVLKKASTQCGNRELSGNTLGHPCGLFLLVVAVLDDTEVRVPVDRSA